MRKTVLSLIQLSPASYLLRIERGDYSFLPGQYAELGLPGIGLMREYSIYSSVQADYLEFLFRTIPGGAVSPALATLTPGDPVELSEPRGEFLISEEERSKPLLFLATGTGISPYHCLISSYPDLQYTLAHGVRGPEDCYAYESYTHSQPLACFSRSEGGAFSGHVTQWLQQQDLSNWQRFFLCGNSDMIYQAFGILQEGGVEREQVRVETYF